MKNLSVLIIILTIALISCSDKTTNPTGSGTNDSDAPAAVSDLTVGFTTGNSATLYLTASGDDGFYGRARTYEVRYSTSTIDASNYARATKFTSPNQPHVGNADDTILVTGLLNNTKYFFVVKVGDEASNFSPISNLVSATTLLGGNWTIYNRNNSGLLSNDIRAIEFNDDTKYISTIHGVSTFDNTNWNTIYESRTMLFDTTIIANDTTVDTTFLGTLDFANSIAIESSSKTWLGTENSGVALLENNTTTYYNSNDSGSIASTRDILISEKKLWVGTLGNGLHSFALDGSNIWEQYDIPIKPSLPGIGKINCLEVDAINVIWTGLQLSGATKFDNSVLTNYSSEQNFTDQAVWDIYTSGDQALFGTDNGAFLFENNSWTHYVAVDSGLPDNAIISVVIDNQGVFWFGSRVGLTSFDGLQWTTYNTSNSMLPSNWINSLNVDMFGNLWIGTSNGLAKFSL